MKECGWPKNPGSRNEKSRGGDRIGTFRVDDIVRQIDSIGQGNGWNKWQPRGGTDGDQVEFVAGKDSFDISFHSKTLGQFHFAKETFPNDEGFRTSLFQRQGKFSLSRIASLSIGFFLQDHYLQVFHAYTPTNKNTPILLFQNFWQLYVSILVNFRVSSGQSSVLGLPAARVV
jgi:hypothetical protein